MESRYFFRWEMDTLWMHQKCRVRETIIIIFEGSRELLIKGSIQFLNRWIIYLLSGCVYGKETISVQTAYSCGHPINCANVQQKKWGIIWSNQCPRRIYVLRFGPSWPLNNYFYFNIPGVHVERFCGVIAMT